MRSAKQQLYDNFYYGFERWLTGAYENVRVLKRIRGKRCGPDFEQAFRTVIRPYWAQFGVRAKRRWAKERYLLNDSTDPRYIPNDLYYTKIVPHFNSIPSVNTLTDKNLNSLLFPDAKRPETAFKHMSGSFCREDFTPLTKEEAIARLEEGSRYVIKPARDSSMGMDVKLFTGPGEGAALVEQYGGLDYLVQRAVVQHPALARLNESSVNTIRLVTLLFQGKPYILSSILRVGGPGSAVDNIGSGGYQCNIGPDGKLLKDVFTRRNGYVEYVEENADGLRFEGYPIPSFDKAQEFVRTQACRAPHLRLIAWDLSIDEDGDVVLIEFNASMPGQNQRTCGPTFGELTEQVLAEVFLPEEERRKFAPRAPAQEKGAQS